MDAKQFLAEFGHIASAPNGVEQLRQMIYNLAISGKLVPQQPEDEPAFELLQRLASERELASQICNANRSKPENEQSVKAEPFTFPIGWQWTRLSKVSRDIRYGYTASANHKMKDCLLLRITDIQNDSVNWNSVPGCVIDKNEISSYALQNGDIVIARTGGTIGKSYLVSGLAQPAVFASYLIRIGRLDSSCPQFIKVFLNSQFYWNQLHEKSMGTGQPNVNGTALKGLIFPLPPLAEQVRINAKVDELMTLCDKLETQQQQRRCLQNNLRQSTLQAVATSTNSHELQTNWTRLADNFGQLFSAPQDVAELRNLVLDLAANGLLSEPHVNDSDPVELLTRVNAQQRDELSARELREISALPEPNYENRRIWLALGHIVKLVSGQHLSPEEYNTQQDGIPYITGPAEFKDRRPYPTKWTTERRAVARTGDVLITVKGSGVGKTARCDLEELAISRQLMAIRSLGDMDGDYLSICIDSAERSFQEQKFGIAIPGVGREEVLSLQILLPSIEEQGRIVKRVSELMRFCDSLESQLRDAQKLAEHLTTAAVATFTGITIEQEEDEPLKTPKTELDTTLRLGTTPNIKEQAPLAAILAHHNGDMVAKHLWQHYGGDINAFYAQLKLEVGKGWIKEPADGGMRETEEV